MDRDDMMADRRAILGWLAGYGVLGWTGSAAAACFDPATLPDASLRASLNFKVASADPKRTCSGCAFFIADQDPSCGACQIFGGGPTSAASVCDSWAARP